MLIVTEKPSVGRDIAHTLGQPVARHEGYLTVGATTITWGFGHLVALAAPEAYQAAWRHWNLNSLPMLPDEFRLEPVKKTAAQLKTVTRLMRAADLIVCATDADREGELIFRYIYRLAGINIPVKRLWLSENTAQAIQSALQAMKPSSAYDALARAAEARSQADWLVGINATRAFTLKHGQTGQGALSVGRVQTPTLRLIADRDKEIAEFQTTPFWQLAVTFQSSPGEYAGHWFNVEDKDTSDRILQKAEATALALKVPPGTQGVIKSVETKRVAIHPPLLFSLNDLQKEGNRRFGLTAQQVLDTAQSLYEKHLISYPRTDAKHITEEIASTIHQRISGLRAQNDYAALIQAMPQPLPTKRLVDDKKVAAAGHYAIIPTGHLSKSLPDREAKVFDIVVRRFIASLMPKGTDERTLVITVAGGQTFRTRGTTVLTAGWRLALHTLKPAHEEDPETDDALIPPGLKAGESVTVIKSTVEEKETKAPPKINDASLLALMEKHGLGTPATRARILEVLLLRGYVERVKKTLVTTEKGQALLTVVPWDIQSPEMTGQWEARLEEIAGGSNDDKQFLSDIRQYTVALVNVAKEQAPHVVSSDLGPCPACATGRIIAGKKGWGCTRWKEGCHFTIWKEVAGKKLTENQVKTLLAGKTTSPLKGFTSKAGKSFSARLVMDRATGNISFVFAPPSTTKRAKKR